MNLPDPKFYKESGKDWTVWAKELIRVLSQNSEANVPTILQSFASSDLPSAEQSGILIFKPDTNAVSVSFGGTWNDLGGGGGGGAPTSAEYLVGVLNGTLSNERLVTNTTSITWDLSTPGAAKANVGTITSGAVSDFTEAAQDAVGAALTNTTSITFTYNDAANTISAAVASITSSAVSDFTEAAQDAIGALVANSTTVTFTYNDAGNTLSANAVVQLSLTSDASGIKLVNDAAAPGNSKYYGTDSGGTKGFFSLPSGSSGGLTLTTVEKDLGSVPADSGSFQITGLSSLTAGKPVLMRKAVGPYTGKGTRADEAEMDLIDVYASCLDTTTIQAYWISSTGPVVGNHKFDYQVSA